MNTTTEHHMLTEEEICCFNQGYQAHKDGALYWDSPYLYNLYLLCSWARGWLAAEAGEASEREAV